jgi:hypothetical protein
MQKSGLSNSRSPGFFKIGIEKRGVLSEQAAGWLSNSLAVSGVRHKKLAILTETNTRTKGDDRQPVWQARFHSGRSSGGR